MRVLISMLAAAGIIGFSLASHADDAVTAPNKPKAAGRAIDDGAPVTAPNKPKAAGRAIDDGTVKADKPKKFGREIDNGTFGTEKPKKYGREIDENGSVKTSKKLKQHGREINADSSAVKTKPDPNKPGRAVQEQKK